MRLCTHAVNKGVFFIPSKFECRIYGVNPFSCFAEKLAKINLNKIESTTDDENRKNQMKCDSLREYKLYLMLE